MRKLPWVRAVLLSCLLIPPGAVADEDERVARITKYRQSLMFLIAQNFGPIAGMVQGEIEWDDARFADFARQVDSLSGLDIMRGFPEGTGGGQTRTKPEVWEEPERFAQLMDDMVAAASAMNSAAAGDDRKAKMKAAGALGKTCKDCHDDFKSKDFLNQ